MNHNYIKKIMFINNKISSINNLRKILERKNCVINQVNIDQDN